MPNLVNVEVQQEIYPEVTPKLLDSSYPIVLQKRKKNSRIVLNHEGDYETETNFFYTSSVQLGDSHFEIQNNDLLFTFASFQYNNVPPLLTDIKKEEVKLRLDDYTNIAISKNMRYMMRRMYKTRRNGKFTRTAKRYKARLANWQKADSIIFDSNLVKNPLDPMDLGDFIFYK